MLDQHNRAAAHMSLSYFHLSKSSQTTRLKPVCWQNWKGILHKGMDVPSLLKFEFLMKDSEEVLREGRPVLGKRLSVQQYKQQNLSSLGTGSLVTV